jgi:hypothetical protein
MPMSCPAPALPAVCHVCGKAADAQHTPATRSAHGDHHARYGWSAMCVSPPNAQGYVPAF